MDGTKRGRPRTFDRDQALTAATELFWRKGYTATSITDLCGVMGIGSPSLYAAFGSKEALYEEAIRNYEGRYRPLIWGRFVEASTAREAIEALLMASAAVLPATGRLGGCGKPGGCMVTLSSVKEEGSERLGEVVDVARRECLAMLEERLARAVAEGDLPAGADTQAVARFYLAVQQGMSIQARDGAQREDLEAVARSAMAVWPTLLRDER
jgi:AcrR family transcriptional regulator